jgi:hypothetical protein
VSLISRCRDIWASFRLLPRKKRLPISCLYLKRHLRLLDGIFPGLLDIRLTPPPNRFQHRWRRPLRFRPSHRTRRPHQARGCRNVHILLLLNRNRFALRHSLRFPVMANSIHCFLHSLPYLPRRRPPFHLRVSEMVPRSRKSKGGDESHALHR